MSISQSLATATSGLGAASRRASIVSSNISNALTPGYSRREVLTTERLISGRPAGVEVTAIQRAQDQALTATRRLAEADASRDSALSQTASYLSEVLGGPEDPFSFFGSVQALEDAFSGLREQPGSATQQKSVIFAAKQLTTNFQQLSAEASRIRQSADAEISGQVDQVNVALKQVEALNLEIRSTIAAGRDSNGLEDQRQRVIDQISGIIPIKELPREGGKVDLVTNEGVFLLAGSAREINFSTTGVFAAGQSYADGHLSGITVDGIDITPGGIGPLQVSGGSLTAQFQIRDDVIPEFGQQLDALAGDLIARFSNPLNDPTLQNGVPGLFTDGGSALDADPEPGIAARIQLNAAVDPNQGGQLWRVRDGIGAQAPGETGNTSVVTTLLDGLRNTRNIDAPGFSGEFSVIDAAAQFVSLRGTQSLFADTQASTSGARAQSLIQAEQEAVGVDTDFELQSLLRVEQAFQANARVIQVVDAMLDQLLEI